jgi:asparagine synthase (glutamine-hydrolysing)
MVHRGPDGAGLWISSDNRLGLVHRRLAVIDLTDAGVQPMSTSDGRLVITFNGEIYNYRQLRRELEAKGFIFRSGSDTEVLLHLYANEGPEMVHRLRGMYAFAIWDAHDQSLFLARDPFGIKPLYYANDGRTFRFASQVKALLKGGGVGQLPEPAGSVGFLIWGYVPEPFTLYRDIRAVPAGSWMVVSRSGVAAKSFFDVRDEFLRAQEARPIRRADVQEVLAQALRDSVRHHLVADVPVGVFLSSGLDSTALTRVASEEGGSPLHTITLGFREYRHTLLDEVPLAESVAMQYGTRHKTQWVTQQDFEEELEQILNMMDQPSIDGVNSYFVSRAAAQAGLKVAISGLGGDELFGGYPSFRHVPLMVRTLWLARLIPGAGVTFQKLVRAFMKGWGSPKYAGLLQYGGSFQGAYFLRRGLYMPWELGRLLDPRFAREGWNQLATLRMLHESICGIASARGKVIALEASWYMKNQLLRDADWTGMAHSLEIRIPLVDIPLWRTVLPYVCTQRRPTKHDLGSIIAPPLRDTLANRPKTGFSVPIMSWLRAKYGATEKDPTLRPWAVYVLSSYGSSASSTARIAEWTG